jgi:tetrapyrrole methylase family protein/MazG family protein
MTVDFGKVAALLERVPSAERPAGGLQVMAAGTPFEPNPLAPTLIVGDGNGASVLAGSIVRAFDGRQAAWLIPARGPAVATTIGALRGQPFAALYVPAVDAETAERSLAALRELVYRLRRECPWDRKQSHQSLTKYVIEEAYEVVDAIEHHGPAEMAEELGDLLLQVFLQAEIAEQAGTFSLNDVVQHLTSKLIRRHPHVFADVQVGGAADVEVNWDALKRAEKAAKAGNSSGDGEERPASALDGIPRSLPALLLAVEQQKRMRKTGFHWAERVQTETKLAEELAELRAAETPEEAAAELGDVLYVLVDLANWHGASAEDALRGTIAKADRRFRHLEAAVRARGLEIADVPLDELVALWNQSKVVDLPLGRPAAAPADSPPA